MRKAALATAFTLLLSLTIASATHSGTSSNSSAPGSNLGYAPIASDFVYPVGSPRITPTFDDNSPNGFRITQMFNNSCDPALGQGFYDAGQYFCGHTGVDLSDKQEGDWVHATANGLVVYAGYNSSYGEMVRIQHLLPDGTYVYSQYEHMVAGSLQVSYGQVVVMGQDIGQVGSTGFVTGPHLHFEIKSVNEDGVGYTFGNAALIVGYDDPIAYVQAHTLHLAPTSTPTLIATPVPPTMTPAAATSMITATVTTTTTTPPSARSESTTAQQGGEQQSVLTSFYKRYKSYVTVTSNKVGLNVRAGSGFEYAPLNSVEKGARLGFLGLTGNGWVHVALPSNVTGYVVRQWVAGGPLPQLPPVVATPSRHGPYVTVLDTRYPARSGPMMHDAPIEALKVGERLSWLETRVSWDKVVLPTGRIGWVLNWYLNGPLVAGRPIHAVPAATPAQAVAGYNAPARASTPRQTRPAVPVAGVSFVVTAVPGLNLRSGPRLAAPVIESLRQGAQLIFHGYHVSWASVTAPDGRRGFVLARYVSAVRTAAAHATTVQPRAKAVQPRAKAVQPGSTTRRVTRTTTARVTRTSVAARGYTAPYVTVTVDAANLRVSPNLKATVIVSEPRGTRLSLHGSRDGWDYVETYNGTLAWVKGSLTGPA